MKADMKRKHNYKRTRGKDRQKYEDNNNRLKQWMNKKADGKMEKKKKENH